jgi:hypothetical protein
MNKPFIILFSGTQGFQRSIELMLVVLTIGILAATMIHAYLPLVSRAKVFNGAIFGFEKYKREIAYHWALYGAWPQNETEMERFYVGVFQKPDEHYYVEKAELEGGGIHVFFNNELGNRILSMRPAVLKEDSSGPVIWVCGSSQTGSSAWTLTGADRTTIDSYYIPKSLQYY